MGAAILRNIVTSNSLIPRPHRLEFLKSLITSLGSWRRVRKPLTIVQSSPLAKLPPELLLEIAEHLPPVAAASFSLTCTDVYFVTAARYLKDNKDFGLLELLERDMVDHIACFYCRKFHAIKNAYRHIYSNRYFLDRCPSSRPARVAPACWLAKHTETHYIHSDFSFIVLQMLMKRHRQGTDCSILLRMLSHEGESLTHPSEIYKSKTLCRIVNGVLLVREHAVVLVRPSRKPKPFPGRGFQICPHFGRARQETLDPIGSVVRRRMATWDEPNSNEAPRNTQCEFCKTEFRFDFKDFGTQGVAIFCTRWLDIGDGRSPQDKVWRSHVDFADHRSRALGSIGFPAGPIQTSFEGTPDSFNFELLVTPKEWQMLFKAAA